MEEIIKPRGPSVRVRESQTWSLCWVMRIRRLRVF